jgi:excisionase family DNA binding protein
MTGRLEAAVSELADAIRAEVRAELADRTDGPPELLSVAQAALRLGVGRTLAYDAIGRGQLRSVKVGRRRLIPADALAELAAPSKQRTGAADTARPSMESRRAPITPDTLPRAG